jgi:photosystem II stability/assembly factor-like uncharacterized protein
MRWRPVSAWTLLLALLNPFGIQSAHAEPVCAEVRADNLLLLDAVVADTRLIAVGERGTILFSDDRGQQWQAAGTPADATLTAVTFPTDRIGYAVGHDAVILKSDDAGAHWRQVYADPAQEAPLLDVWFRDAEHGYAVGAYGLMLSTTDGGEHWSQPDSIPDDRHLYALTGLTDGGLLLAGEAGALFRSDDNGASWHTLEAPYGGSFFGILHAADDSLLIYGLRGHVFRSTDGGQTWQEIDTGVNAALVGATVLNDGRIAFAGNDGSLIVGAANAVVLDVTHHPDNKTLAAIIDTAHGDLLLFGEAGVTHLPWGTAR